MNSFPQREREGRPTPLSEIARLLAVDLIDAHESLTLRGVAPLRGCRPDQIGFLAQKRYLPELAESGAQVVLTSEAFLPQLEKGRWIPLVVPDPHRALASLLQHFHPLVPRVPAIHPTAVLGQGVRLGEGVTIGPYAVLEDEVQVGGETVLGAHVVVGRGARIGAGATLHPHSVVYPESSLGDGVVLHAGACVGVDGFGYVFVDGVHRPVPQIGRAVLEEGVEVGANTTIDRGSLGDTRVGAGTKLDNLVQLGHNVTLGPHTVVAAQAGVAGSTTMGAGVQMGGQSGAGGHLSIGDGAQLAARSGAIKDVAAGSVVMGFPARPRREFLRSAAQQNRIPKLEERIRVLEERLTSLMHGGTKGGKT